MRTTYFGALVLPLLLTVACAAQTRADDDDTQGGPDAGGGEPCSSPGITRCSGQEYQTCTDGTWTTTETCTGAETCYGLDGCNECDPTSVQVCVGNDVYSCSGGMLGGMVQSCGAMMCMGGSCGGDPNQNCSEATQLIYVVDTSYNLLSFDPRQDANTFHVIGSLHCPAGPPLEIGPDQPPGPATPFSMSVDRQGRAWVLYTSGEIFLVSTTDASCQASGFVGGSGGFELFGMGFVTNTAGGSDETLFISGGAALGAGGNASDLGAVVPSTYATTRVGAMPVHAPNSPELTGTGNAELWAYYPGGNGIVAQINKATGASMHDYTLPSVTSGGRQVTAWAFAHYGGRYYIFVSTNDLFGFSPKNLVLRLDPMGNGGQGATTTIIDNSNYEVVGAGVSTCAPVVVN
jgi:hypothetical protein